MNLAELVMAHKGDMTWEHLAEKVGGLGHKRWQQWGLNKPPLKAYPDPPSIRIIAETLGVSEQLVIDACSESLGMATKDEGGLFVTMMRSLRGTERLTDGEVLAFVSLVRNAVERETARQAAEERAAAPAPVPPAARKAPAKAPARPAVKVPGRKAPARRS